MSVCRFNQATSGAGLVALFAITFVSASAVSTGAIGFGEDKTWPCVQRKVPDVSVGVVWSGVSLDFASNEWVRDPQISRLVARTTSRRISIEQANQLITTYASSLGANKSVKLHRLFVGQFQTINLERRDVIRGISRYARRQEGLARTIKKSAVTLAKLRSEQQPLSTNGLRERDRLQRKLAWDTRVYDDRQQSLQYVCETPVLLEQRLFQFAKTIQGLISAGN